MGRSNRPREGHRERVAGKRHFRGRVSFGLPGVPGWVTLKLGHKKMVAFMRLDIRRLSVADHERLLRMAQGDPTAGHTPPSKEESEGGP
jgi:hypothetical protein